MECHLIIFKEFTASLVCFALSENTFQFLVWRGVVDRLWYRTWNPMVLWWIDDDERKTLHEIVSYKIQDHSRSLLFVLLHEKTIFESWFFFRSWTEYEFVPEIQWYCIAWMMMTLELEMERSLIIFERFTVSLIFLI